MPRMSVLQRVDSPPLICLLMVVSTTTLVSLGAGTSSDHPLEMDMPLRANDFVNVEEAEQRVYAADPQQPNQAALA